MVPKVSALVLAAFSLLWYANPCLAQNTPENGTPSKSPASPKTGDLKAPGEATQPSPDNIQLPPNAVVVIVDQLKQAQQMIPDLYAMSAARYQELVQRIEELEKKLHP